MNKTELFRQINSIAPPVTEQLLNLWGRPELMAYINNLLHSPAALVKAGLNQGATKLLEELKQLHLAEHPEQIEQSSLNVPEGLANNESFNILNAQFPRIGARICELWGSKDFAPFINGLLQDTRDGQRQGFQQDAAVAMFRLTQKHDVDFPKLAATMSDIWSVTNKR